MDKPALQSMIEAAPESMIIIDTNQPYTFSNLPYTRSAPQPWAMGPELYNFLHKPRTKEERDAIMKSYEEEFIKPLLQAAGLI